MGITLPQTSYNQFPAQAYDGMLEGTASKVDTGICAAALDAGRGLVQSAATTTSDPDSVKLPALAADVTNHFKGVAIYLAAKMPIAGSSLRYAAKDAVPMLRRGRIWVFPEGDILEDGAVFVVNGTAGGTPGKFRGDANSGAATTLGINAICRRGATLASGLPALLEFNLP